MINDTEVKKVSRFLLATRDAHELYRKYGGYELLRNPERWMERINPEISESDYLQKLTNLPGNENISPV